MRNTSFFLNPTELKDRQLFVLPINHRLYSRRNFMTNLVLKLDRVHDIHTGYQNLHQDLGYELVYRIQKKCYRFRLFYPFKKEILDDLLYLVKMRDVDDELKRIGFIRDHQSFIGAASIILRARRVAPEIKAKYLKEQLLEHLGKYLDCDMYSLSPASENEK